VLESRPPGVCIWFTGQSGAGKSTITRALVPLLESQGRTVSVLDVVPLLRKRWWESSSEGKLLRKAYVASQIVAHGGVAVAVTVSARPAVREKARDIVGSDRFVEVRVAPPREVAEQRKAARPKRPRLVKRVRRLVRAVIARLSPGRKDIAVRDPDLVIDSSVVSASDAAEAILRLLVARGLMAPSGG